MSGPPAGTRLRTELHYHKVYNFLCPDYAVYWRDIGMALGFLPNELSSIQSNPLILVRGDIGCLGEMLSRWFQWAPRDGRGSTNFATFEALHEALLNVPGTASIAYDLEEAIGTQKEKVQLPQHRSTPQKFGVAAGNEPNSPQRTEPTAQESDDCVKLKSCLEKHGFQFVNKDQKALIDEGIVDIETIIEYTSEELDGLFLNLTTPCRKKLKKFWTQKQHKEDGNPGDEIVKRPSQETEQPHSIVNHPTQESRQQDNAPHGKPVIGTANSTNIRQNVASNPVATSNSGPEINSKGEPTAATKPAVPHAGNDEDSESEDDCYYDPDSDPEQSDSGDDGPECDGLRRKEFFKPHPRVFKDGKSTYQPKLKLDDDSRTLTTIETAPIEPPNEGKCYKMKSKEHGVAVIINNKTFKDKMKHKKRRGTDRDEDNLVETFRYLGYRVKVRRQCKKDKIKRLFDTMKRWIKADDDSFVCCILSHGGDNIVYGSDSESVPLRIDDGSIEMRVARSLRGVLVGKPKLFFISTCRGGLRGTGIPTTRPAPERDETQYVADRADFAFYHSTLPGETSWRDPTTGTFYINQLCRVLCEKASAYSLSRMQKEVIENVKKITTDDYQVPSKEDNLDKTVYFFDDLV